MNQYKHQEMVKEAVKGKFYGHQTIKSKRTPLYPDSAEREFRRISNGYMRLLNKTLAEHLPTLMDAYKKERRGDSRFDDARDLEDDVRQEFVQIAKELEQKLAAYGLEELVAKISKMTKNSSLREWKKAVHETLGLDLMDDYYSADFYEEALRRWVDENVLKIRSIPKEALGEMQRIVLDGYRSGATVTDITMMIQEQYRLTRRKAQLLARDQVSSLNAKLSKMQQQDAGCTKYRWSDSRDSRVRDCHRSLNGKIFSWDDPPEMWYDTKSRGRVYTGRHCHPGEDIACRCVAIPVFDIETIDVPMKDKIQPRIEP